jgi:hypothetical protein
MLHPGSRFQMAGDLLETYLLWLIEAHAHAWEAGRVRCRYLSSSIRSSTWVFPLASQPAGTSMQVGEHHVAEYDHGQGAPAAIALANSSRRPRSSADRPAAHAWGKSSRTRRDQPT